MGIVLSNAEAVRVSSLPLCSSSPIERMPTRGRSSLKISLEYRCPIKANWASISALQSTLAPTSTMTAGLPVSVGKAVANAGRSMPGTTPWTIFAVAMTAPVLPAETTPWAWPSRTKRQATRMEESFLLRSDLPAESSIVTTSLACTTVMGRLFQPG